MSEKECCIPFCPFSDADPVAGKPLLMACPGGHYLHEGCLKGILRSDPDPKCPQCRDPYLSTLKALMGTVEEPLVPLGMDEFDDDDPQFLTGNMFADVVLVNLLSMVHGHIEGLVDGPGYLPDGDIVPRYASVPPYGISG
jgi:hypothetical protein